jgi:hypothetical protein
MGSDSMPILDYTSRRPTRGWRAAAVVLALGLVLGVLLGWCITGFGAGTPPPLIGDPDAEKVPVIRISRLTGIVLAAGAGLLVGLAALRLDRKHPLPLSLAAAVLAAGASVATIILLQWHRGRWAVGVIDGRTFFVAAVLWFLICTAALMAVALPTFARRLRP